MSSKFSLQDNIKVVLLNAGLIKIERSSKSTAYLVLKSGVIIETMDQICANDRLEIVETPLDKGIVKVLQQRAPQSILIQRFPTSSSSSSSDTVGSKRSSGPSSATNQE